MPSWRPAAEKLPASTTVTNTDMASKRSTDIPETGRAYTNTNP
jgi:hypothetical protein